MFSGGIYKKDISERNVLIFILILVIILLTLNIIYVLVTHLQMEQKIQESTK